MMLSFAVLLLPALVFAKIDIEISGSVTGKNEDLKVRFYGQDVSVISEVETQSFKLYDSNLKDAIRAYYGARPNDAYIRSPTPWGDLYKTYGWEQVKRTLVPRNAKVLKVTSEPTIVLEQVFENNSSKPANYNVGISQAVTNTVSSRWSKQEQLTVNQEINYNIDIMAAEIGGSTSFGYSSAWGYDEEKSESVTVGSTASVELMLEPGQSVLAQLHATRGKILVEVEYQASLSGVVSTNYDDAYRGHHFWALPVTSVMDSGRMNNNLLSKETIEIGFFSDARVTVHDRQMKYKLLDVAY